MSFIPTLCDSFGAERKVLNTDYPLGAAGSHHLLCTAAAAELVPNKLVLRGAITAMNDAAAAAAAASGGATAAMGTEARFSIPLYIDARWLFFHANGSFFNAYTHCS